MERAESYKLSVAQGMMAWNPGEESEKMCGISKFSTRMQQGSVSGRWLFGFGFGFAQSLKLFPYCP